MAKVVVLETGSKRANRHTVEMLEEALAEAKEGAIQECALALVYEAGYTGYRRSSTESISTMIGSVSILLHNLHLEADAASE